MGKQEGNRATQGHKSGNNLKTTTRNMQCPSWGPTSFPRSVFLGFFDNRPICDGKRCRGFDAFSYPEQFPFWEGEDFSPSIVYALYSIVYYLLALIMKNIHIHTHTYED